MNTPTHNNHFTNIINGIIEFYTDMISYHSLFIYISMFLLNMLYPLTTVIVLSYHLICVSISE